MTVLLWLARLVSMVCRVRRGKAPDLLKISEAFCRLIEAVSSPSARIITARRSRSASACLAITRLMSAGSSMSCILIAVTSTPQSAVSLSTMTLISSLIFWRSERSSSRVTEPIMSRRAV